ncbi:MAG: hypothetical protein ACPLRS_04250 [Hydrogenobacter sp.]
MSKNYKEELVLLLNGKNTVFERKLKSMIITIARRSGLETPLTEKYGRDFVEDIYSEFFIHLMENKHSLLSKEFISINYISVMIKNLMVDKLNGSRYVKTVSYEELNYKDDEGREISFESLIKDEREFFSQHEGDQLFNLILKSLDQKDLIALCYYLTYYIKGVKPKVKSMSANNLYKRKERLKLKISKYLEGLSDQDARYLFEKLLSEVCEKLDY